MIGSEVGIRPALEAETVVKVEVEVQVVQLLETRVGEANQPESKAVLQVEYRVVLRTEVVTQVEV